MKKKWQIIMGLALSLVTMITATAPALALGEQQTATEASINRGALAIVAPLAVPVNKEFTARVFLRENQEPFQGAGVWAIDTDSAEKLKDELGELREGSNELNGGKDYESILEKRAIFLGRTGADGRVAYAFKQAGGYILVAARNGYLPGFNRIKVGENIKALGIKAPKRGPVGEKITIGVFARLTREPVESAGVWAVSKDNAETLQLEAQKLKDDPAIAADEKDYEAVIKARGQFLGRTDKDGQLTHAFKEAGIFVLVAAKKGYFPGYAPLAVVNQPKALAIKATPPQSHVGKEVTLSVFEKTGNDPVEKAGIWAIEKDIANELRDVLKPNSVNTTGEMDYEAAVASLGAFLGRTDKDGKLKATFDSPGLYVLVTVKKGYLPGFTTLGIREAPKPKPTISDNRTAPRAVKPVTPELRPGTTPPKVAPRNQTTPNTN